MSRRDPPPPYAEPPAPAAAAAAALRTPDGDVLVRGGDGFLYRRSVCLLVADRRGLLLAGRRRDDRRVLQCVQGGARGAETPRETAGRELLEEVGLPLAALRLVGEVLPPGASGPEARAAFRYPSKSWRRFGVRGQELYPLLLLAESDVAQSVRFDAVPGVRREFCEVHWVQLSELVERAPRSKKEVMKNICEAAAPMIEELCWEALSDERVNTENVEQPQQKKKAAA